jgi:predicted ABC-type ATPase
MAGFEITLFFIWLDSFELAKSRVASRVRKGGHSISDDVVERRYQKGIANFSKYAEKSDNWYLYDNSGAEYILIAKCIDGEREIINFELFKKITET